MRARRQSHITIEIAGAVKTTVIIVEAKINEVGVEVENVVVEVEIISAKTSVGVAKVEIEVTVKVRIDVPEAGVVVDLQKNCPHHHRHRGHCPSRSKPH